MTLKRYLPWLPLRFVFFIFFLLISSSIYAQARAKNIILFIGDGLGQAHVVAARVFAQGPEGRLNMETLEHSGYVTTFTSAEFITDSAAAGTALATGHKTKKGRLGQSTSGENYKSILEIAKEMGKATGLVTTTEVTHATPAAFAAHETSRDSAQAIARDYLQGPRPEVIFGGGSRFWPHELLNDARAKGYTIINKKWELEHLDLTRVKKVLGTFTPGHLGFVGERGLEEPSLKEMSLKALELLDRDPEGFFLMIEGGRIDHAGHDNDIRKLIFEMMDFDEAVGAVLEWLKAGEGRTLETLVIVTSDHETGGLSIIGPERHLPKKGEIVQVYWGSSQHTAVDVPIWAQGPGSERVKGKMDNTEVFELMWDAMALYEETPRP
ncbi:MAG: alkaline phosphatase [Candidatus Brocadiales bacterium]|nr:alkaline phosphatase [Candidatus Brocadiales bacterium]